MEPGPNPYLDRPQPLLSEIDLEALRRAIPLARALSPLRRWQIDAMLREPGPGGWEETATFCAYLCQCHALGLEEEFPPPPCHADPYATDGYGDPAAVELLERLLMAGLSRWEPEPLKALERAEAAAMKPAA